MLVNFSKDRVIFFRFFVLIRPLEYVVEKNVCLPLVIECTKKRFDILEGRVKILFRFSIFVRPPEYVIQINDMIAESPWINTTSRNRVPRTCGSPYDERRRWKVPVGSLSKVTPGHVFPDS